MTCPVASNQEIFAGTGPSFDSSSFFFSLPGKASDHQGVRRNTQNYLAFKKIMEFAVAIKQPGTRCDAASFPAPVAECLPARRYSRNWQPAQANGGRSPTRISWPMHPRSSSLPSYVKAPNKSCGALSQPSQTPTPSRMPALYIHST